MKRDKAVASRPVFHGFLEEEERSLNWPFCSYKNTYVDDHIFRENEGGYVFEFVHSLQDLSHRLGERLLFHGTYSHDDVLLALFAGAAEVNAIVQGGLKNKLIFLIFGGSK